MYKSIKEDSIIERMYIKANVILKSPCIIGSCDSSITDYDIIKDSNGVPYLPGTSLAGVIRSYASDNEINESGAVEELFGQKGKNSKLSCLYISDSDFENYKISTRDGIEVDKHKVAITNSKYDYEVVETGVNFYIRFELVIRKCNEKNIEAFKRILFKILKGMSEEEIYVGAKTSKGFGSIKLLEHSLQILDLKFDKNTDNFEKWLNFDWNNIKGNISINQLIDNSCKFKHLYKKITAEFNIESSILVRTYSRNPEDVDYEHLYCNSNPVIPGTTWNGALRHGALNILNELNVKNPKNIIDYVFGYVNKESKEANGSDIIIAESIIRDNGGAKTKLLPQTRVKIDRFTGGAVDSALFNEKAQYFGKTNLEIKISNNSNSNFVIGLLLLLIKDISNGLLPIGGETSIGRGIMSLISLKLDGEQITQTQEKEFSKQFADYLNKRG